MLCELAVSKARVTVSMSAMSSVCVLNDVTLRFVNPFS